ncbi:hypothetical protein, partial [Bacillus sp. AFS040349]|uniref:hypothetical protein n=1 Tax=Bacillus sp. AFS040349 TaxID=2033502 RepID=UPI000C03585F
RFSVASLNKGVFLVNTFIKNFRGVLMVFQGFKKVIWLWLLIGSTILSSIFSIAMLALGLKSYNEILRIKRRC